jgi:ATP-dependent Zn protease
MANIPTNRQNQNSKTWMLIIALGIVLFVLLQSMIVKPEGYQNKGFSEFMAAVNLPADQDEKIVEVTFRGQVMLGKTKNEAKVKSTGPLADLNLRKELEEKGVKVNYEAPEEQSWWKAF